MGNNGKKRLLKKGHIPEFREWLNAGIGLAALLLALVSFWTTARISGLEEYLRSEITRRNSDLDQLSERSASIEKLANEREAQLASLDAATSEILASSLLAQSQLAQVQSEVATARSRLAAAQLSRSNIENSLRDQSQNFDLFQRRQTFEQASLGLTLAGSIRMEEPSGRALLEQVRLLPEPAGRDENRRYLRLIKSDFEKVCPTFVSRLPKLPDRLPNPGSATDRMIDAIRDNRESVMAQDKLAIANWSREYEAYLEREKEYSQAKVDATFKLIIVARDCMCGTLTTNQFQKADICPPDGPR